ncbi:MAG: hypothetical protein WBA87_15625 [Microbacterium sp.]
MKTKEQALRDAGRVIAKAMQELAQMTPREAAERVWVPGGPSIEELSARCAAAGLCRAADQS